MNISGRRTPVRRPVVVPAAFVGIPFLLLAGCGKEEAALQVGPIGYEAAEISRLGPDQVELLAALVALGLAVSEGRIEEAGAVRMQARATELLVDRLREEIILESAGVTEADLEARYETAPEYELLVRHVVILSERWEAAATRRAARDRAAEALQRIASGEPFEEVAAAMSEEPGADRRGGLISPGRRGSWVSDFWDAASALPVGGTSPVVESPYGYHVIRLEERSPLPFHEVRPLVVRSVARTLGGGEGWEEFRTTQSAAVERTETPPPSFRTLIELLEEGHVSPGVGPTAGQDGGPGEAIAAETIAEWPGGSLSMGSFRTHLLSLPTSELRRLGADSAALESEIRRVAERHHLAGLARDRGIAPRDDEVADALRTWTSAAGEWAATFGFRAGMSPERIRELAFTALGTTGQGARLARTAVADAAPTLLGSYPVRLPRHDDAGGDR